MSLIVKTVLRLSEKAIENQEASKVYLKVPKKVLSMYDIKPGCTINGAVENVNRLMQYDNDGIPEIRTEAKDYSSITGTKLKMYFYNGSEDSDYLFFPKQFSVKLTSYAIFPDDYLIKIQLDNIACGWKHIKLYSETQVNFDDTGQYYE